MDLIDGYPEETCAFIGFFMMDVRYQNRGIGTEVLRRCIREQLKPLTLCVFTKNTGAIALYSRMGFRVTERISNTRCIMRREVP
jgi:ribosomal protein S18 acetylase RimI-like enzyme